MSTAAFGADVLCANAASASVFMTTRSMQVLDPNAHKSIPNVMRWYNTVLSHPSVAEFVRSTPSASASSSSSAPSSTVIPDAQTNGFSHDQSSRNEATSSFQSTSQTRSSTLSSTPALSGGPSDHKQGQEAKAKGKDSKGGKLAKNDVAKGQKKGGSTKDKPVQAQKSQGGCQNSTHAYTQGFFE